ncbi:MAG: hypothetical protein ACHRXM_02020 [Isosphaerales bacterium]
MSHDAPLLPPVRVINERLTQNQRERRRLRTLLRLAIEVGDEEHQTVRKSQPETIGRSEAVAS